MAESLLVLITKPPYGLEEAFAGARLALGGKVSGIMDNSNLLLMGDGTLNALETQSPGAVGMPSNLEALQDIIDLDGSVYCVEPDLRARAGDMKVLEGVKLISWEEARAVVKAHQLVNTF
ncbi:MAG: DsrE family protein [Methanomassiliicoccus sp.]|nr:DsrE family protein [Methanomassiliicoccus sp.]